jgi:[FeFe] hydrogenase H-cluster maturation GTPase HydF
MGLNDKVSAERVHIGFFGLRNAGKSSVVNAVTGQSLSLVSETKGTTTDPVQKAMELLPIGPVVIIDTPGIDDVGTLGEMRVKRALQVLDKTDIAILVVDADKGLQQADQELLKLFEEKKIPHITVYNKSDLLATVPSLPEKQPEKNDAIYVSAKNGDQIYELKERIGALTKAASAKADEKRILADLIQPEDVVVLVVPIDSAAPKGRLILPQQQTIRDVLESGAISVVTRETELPQTLRSLAKKPAMVITDSQAFQKVNADTPADVPLTSFSILFARYKGDLKEAVHGAAQLDKLQNGDTVLISEGCTHHRQCGDIGTVKLPNWIRKYTGKELSFEFTSGGEFPEDLSPYALVVHCGGCMLNEREMKARIARAVAQNVPITNYGICIAQVHGILKRSVELFSDVAAELQ